MIFGGGMDIIHRISFLMGKNKKLFDIISKGGLKYQKSNKNRNEIISININEKCEVWNKIKPYINNDGVLHGYDSYFSDEEIYKAKWVRLVNIKSLSYPEPKSSWVTKPTNYNYICPHCGIHEQNSAFRISDEPPKGNASIFSLEWTGDKIFIFKNCISIFTENNIHGIEFWPVIIHKTGMESELVSQIAILQQTNGGYVRNDSIPEVCHYCRKEKFEYHRNGFMQYSKSSFPAGYDILGSNEWFGAGMKHYAHKEIFISHRIVHIIYDHKWSGFRLKPIELV